MKKTFTLIMLLCITCIGAWADEAEVITTVSADFRLTVDELLGMKDTGKWYGFHTTQRDDWSSFSSSSTGHKSITKDELFTLVSGSSDDYVWVKNAKGELLTSVGSGSNPVFTATETGGFDLKFVQSELSHGSFAANTQYRMKNSGGNNLRVNNKDFATATGDWARYVAYGPFYLVTLDYQCNGETVEKKEDVIMSEGAYNEVPDGYNLSGSVNIDHSGTYIIEVTRNDNQVSFTYSYKYNGVEKFTESVTAYVGHKFPNAATVTTKIPFGISVASAPSGDVAETDANTTIDITLASALPFEFYADYASVNKWYALKGHSNYPSWLYSNGESLELTVSHASRGVTSAYAWAFIGDPFTGFKIVNKAATEAHEGTLYMLSDDSPCALTTTDNVVNLDASTSNAGAQFFGIYKDGTGAGKYYNVRHNPDRIERWSSADAGSTFQVQEYTPIDNTIVEFKEAGLGYSTIFSEYGLKIADNVEAYYVTYNAETGNLTAHEIENVIPANTGVVLYYDGSISGVEAVEFDITYETATTDVQSNVLTGTLAEIAKVENSYVFSVVEGKPGFYQFAGDNLAAHKAYYVPSAPSAEVQGYVIDFGGLSTGINNVNADLNLKSGSFDLQGRRVNKAARGLYIQNGVKVIH